MTTPGPSTIEDNRRWWLRALIASAALAGLLISIYVLTPVAVKAYYAWRWRNTSLDQMAQKLFDVRDLTGSYPGFQKPLIPRRELISQIRALIGEHNWPEGKTNLSLNAGKLVVVQRPEALIRISEYIEGKRQEFIKLINIEVRFLVGPDCAKLLASAGGKSGGTLTPAQARRLTALIQEKQGRALWTLRTTYWNQQSARISKDFKPRSYTSGHDASGKPLTRVLRLGASLRVQPIASDDLKRVMLHLQPSCRQLLTMRTEATPAGSVEVPEIDQRHGKATVTVPDGYWAALILEPERSVPKGEKQAGITIVVLVRALIVDSSDPKRRSWADAR
jgi:hypothetical protein